MIRFLQTYIQLLRWYFQFFICTIFRRYNQYVERMPEDVFTAPLILVPHSDDEWIGPYSILKRAAQNTTCVYLNLFGNDYSKRNKKIRNYEIRRSSLFWGFKLVSINLDNTNLLLYYLNKHNYVFVPSPYDWHPEHRKVFQMLYQALCMLSEEDRVCKQIYYYSVSVPHRIGESVHYVQLSKKEIDEKWSNFNTIYHSQSFMPSLRYKLNLRLVPSKCGYAAQFFIPVDFKRLKQDYEQLMDCIYVEKINSLIYKINNLYQVRKIEIKDETI